MLQQDQGPSARVEECGEGKALRAGGSPAHSLLSSSLPPSPASRGCGLWLDGSRGVDRRHHSQDPQEVSLLSTSAFQSCVPPAAAEAHCTGTPFKPPGFFAIDFLSKFPFDYLSENKILQLSITCFLCHCCCCVRAVVLILDASSKNFLLCFHLAASNQVKQIMKLSGLKKGTKYWAFLLLTKFISVLFQLAPILAKRKTSGYILWKQIIELLWAHHGADQHRALKVCSTFTCISKVQIRNRRIFTQC